MHEIVVISGKGGAGKTSLTGAFAYLAGAHILCDFDVDTPDLHILLEPEPVFKHEFWSGHEAFIDSQKCSACGLCASLCRFDAIDLQCESHYQVNPLRCEGCNVCAEFCPEKAIDLREKQCGLWFVSQTRVGDFIHAQLFPGEENSGLLVSLLKQEARKLAQAKGIELILSDGAPGIGCPVISSLRGANLAVIVTEPTLSGKHDFERVAALCEHFRLPVAVLVNKYDLNLKETQHIHEICRQKNYAYLGEIPYDSRVVDAMVARRLLTEGPRNALADQVAIIWDRLCALLT